MRIYRSLPDCKEDVLNCKPMSELNKKVWEEVFQIWENDTEGIYPLWAIASLAKDGQGLTFEFFVREAYNMTQLIKNPR